MKQDNSIHRSDTMPSVNQEKIQATPSGLSFKEQMQLKKHRITNIIAIVIISFYLVTVVVQAWKGTINVLEEVRVLVFIIVGYYFGRGIENGN